MITITPMNGLVLGNELQTFIIIIAKVVAASERYNCGLRQWHAEILWVDT